MTICGKPMLYYSIDAFSKSQVDQIVVVTSAEDMKYVATQIVEKYSFDKVTDIVVGGSERYESVMNGLTQVEGDYVLIHDGARPMLTQPIINSCIEGAIVHKACVAGVPVKDTIKEVAQDNSVVSTPDRSKLYITQTPQAFETSLIEQAYAQLQEDGNTNVTDDAMVVENYTDTKVYFVESDYRNIKVTTPEDIGIAELFIGQNH